MSWLGHLRRVALAISAAAFAGISIGSLVAPHFMAEPLGYVLDNANAMNEFRAIYVGLWLAKALIFGWAARKIHERMLGDVAGLLLAGQVVGRVTSLVLDGMPDHRIWPVALAEFVGAVVILATRSSAQSL